MSESLQKPANGGQAMTIIAIIAIIVGFVLRVVSRTSGSLWEDEVIAATHAVQPVLRLLANVIINDIHPPLYFLELHFWSAFGTSDIWLIANSVVLSFIALLSIYIVIRRLHGASAALFSTAAFALLPSAIWMAEEVRMYAMLSILLIWMYYFTYKAYALADKKFCTRAAIFLLALAIVYTHAIGFIAVFLFGLYAASFLLTQRAPMRAWIGWLLLFGAVGLFALPMLAGGLIHEADMQPVTSVHDILSWMAAAVTGEGYRESAALCMAGLITYGIVCISGLINAQTRRVALCFLLTPILLSAALGILVRPLFKADFFSTLYAPFLAITIGMLLLSLRKQAVLRAAFIGVCILLAGTAVANRAVLNGHNGYYPRIAAYIESQKQPGDVVWVPQPSIFWGMEWYLIGPRASSPVAVRPQLRPGSRWWQVADRLGPELTQKLELIPTSQAVQMKDSTPIITGTTVVPELMGAKRIWLVVYSPRGDLPAGLVGDKLGSLHKDQSMAFAPLLVNLYQ